MLNPDSGGDFHKFWEYIPWAAENDAAILLKGHLLLEELLRSYCASQFPNAVHIERARLTFSQVDELTQALDSGSPEKWLWPAVAKINAMRNALAHRMDATRLEHARAQLLNLVSPHTPLAFETMTTRLQKTAVAVYLTYASVAKHLHHMPSALELQ